MKKNLFKVLFLVCSMALVFTGCKDDDDDKVNAPDSLVGTSWLYDTDETTTVNGVEVGVGVEINFETATSGNIAILVGAESDDAIAIDGFEAGTFTYTYSKPNVTLTDEDGEKITGKIDGNKLTIDGDVFELEED